MSANCLINRALSEHSFFYSLDGVGATPVIDACKQSASGMCTDFGVVIIPVASATANVCMFYCICYVVTFIIFVV